MEFERHAEGVQKVDGTVFNAARLRKYSRPGCGDG